MYIAVLHASAHRNLGISWSYNIALVAPTIFLFSLCESILLWVVWSCPLPFDALLCIKPREGLICVLASIVCLKHLDISSYYVLYKSLKLFKAIEDLVLCLQEIDLSFPGEVNDKGHKLCITPRDIVNNEPHISKCIN